MLLKGAVKLDCSQFPIFRVIVEIECVLPLMAGILIFRCIEGAGGDYSSRGWGARKIEGLY